MEQISDPVQRKAIETMIKTWGQTPKQLFNSYHPSATVVKKSSLSSLSSLQSLASSTNSLLHFNSNSIHNLIQNVKWGSYVGSLEQSQSPVCVWKESCKKNISSLITLPSNDIIALSQHKCVLLERAKENSKFNYAKKETTVLNGL